MRRPALFPALLMPVRHASSNFIPKRVKHRKHFKGRVRGYASNGKELLLLLLASKEDIKATRSCTAHMASRSSSLSA